MKKASLEELLCEIPTEILDLLGNPPILSNEDRTHYNAMIGFFAKSIQPQDFIAWMLIKDLADYRMEIARYRRLKIAVLHRAGRDEISQCVSSLYSSLSRKEENLKQNANKQKEEFAKQGKSSEEVATKFKEINNALAIAIAAAQVSTKSKIDALNTHKLTDDEFVAITKFGGIESLERLDTLLRSAEERFVAAVYEIDHHLAGLGARFREELQEEARKVIDLVSVAGSRPNTPAKADQIGLALADRRHPKARKRARGAGDLPT